jgi:hypothetical protein
MSLTTKQNAQVNQGNAIVATYNEADKSLATSSFITSKVGRKITQATSTTTITNDTVTYDFLEDGISLYSLKLIFTDGSQSTMLSVERIS